MDLVSWKLHSIVMDLFEKIGGSTADDIVNYCENQLAFYLSYSESVAVFTDAEATMTAAGHIFVERAY
jgi:hypothetical protein